MQQEQKLQMFQATLTEAQWAKMGRTAASGSGISKTTSVTCFSLFCRTLSP
jgi:hypothetical protein